jgi:hypothetical protein
MVSINTCKPPKICCHMIQFFVFQNFDKMCISNLMTILRTLGKFEKFETCLIKFSKKNQQKMKILYVTNIFEPNNICHKA